MTTPIPQRPRITFKDVSRIRASFAAEQAQRSLQLNPGDFPDLSPEDVGSVPAESLRPIPGLATGDGPEIPQGT